MTPDFAAAQQKKRNAAAKRKAKTAEKKLQEAEKKEEKPTRVTRGQKRKASVDNGAATDEGTTATSSLKAKQPKLDDSSEDVRPEDTPIKATFYVYVESPPTGVTRGKKNVLPTVVTRGPFFSTVETSYAMFKCYLARVLPCKPDNVPAKHLQWKYEKPNIDKKKPMSDSMGYEAMITSLKGRTKDHVVNLYMPPPQKDEVVSH